MKHILGWMGIMLALTMSYAKTIPVGKGMTVLTLKEGIAMALPGDTLLLKPGTYREGNILIEKPLVILGENHPVLDGQHLHEVITITADHVVISGLTIINSGTGSIRDVSGISADGADGLVIRNNELTDNFFGIHLTNCQQAVVENNRLGSGLRAEHETGNGIHLWKCNKALIKNNTINGHRDGIYFEFVTHSTIEGNRSERNMRYGLHFMFSSDDDYVNNTFSNNGAGVAVMYSAHVKMKGNRFTHNQGAASYGLLLKDIRDSDIEGNVFYHNTIGIYMEGTSRGIFKGNVFSENGWAIKLQASCDDNVFSYSNFSGNTFDITTNGSLVLNTIDNNYWDKYQGYDLKRDGTGDVPFRPVSMYAMIAERVPMAILLWRSFLVYLLDKSERVIPAMTPENLKDNNPRMKPYDIR